MGQSSSRQSVPSKWFADAVASEECSLTFSRRGHIGERQSAPQIPVLPSTLRSALCAQTPAFDVFPAMMGAPIQCTSIAEACKSNRTSISNSIPSLPSSVSSQSACGMPTGIQNSPLRIQPSCLSDDEGQTTAQQQPILVGAAAAIQQMMQRQHQQKHHLHQEPVQVKLASSAPQ